MAWLDELVSYAEGQLDDRVREALWSRGASDEQIALFKVGYLDRNLPDIELPKEFLKWSDGGAKLVDGFVFPLTNTQGEIKGIQMRSVDRDKSGYMDFFLDRFEPVFFGLGQAMESVWSTESLVIVEGTFDFFPVQRFFPNSVPTLTANVSEIFVRTLRRLVRQVYSFYDNDPAGIKANRKLVEEHGSEFGVRVVEYPLVARPDGKTIKDPGELWEAWGDERFEPFLRSALE